MTKTKSQFAISAVAFLGCALVGAACDSNSTSEGGMAGAPGSGGRGTAGSPSSAGSPSAAGAVSMAGAPSASAGSSGASGAAGANCSPLPSNWLLTDFSSATLKGVVEGSSWTAGKPELWGSATSLTGGDAFYQGKPESAPKVTLHGETLTVSATIAAGDYAGYMFNFKPACTDASATQGLQFEVVEGSTLGNATLKLQMQQKSNYPSTANPGTRPGDCVPTSMATQYNDCLSPALTVASSGSTLSAGTTQLLWSNFGGGSPIYALDSNQLMAIQWQFECPPDGGTVSAAGGSGGGAGASGMSGAAGAAAGGSSGGGGAAGLAGGTNSAGAGSGSGGASGFGGASGALGTAGSGGGSGSAGSSGTSGVGGASGSGGNNATAGSSGVAGFSGAAGGGANTTPPCVVSFTFDNVKFY